jgi:hypothetical protein
MFRIAGPMPLDDATKWARNLLNPKNFQNPLNQTLLNPLNPP